MWLKDQGIVYILRDQANGNILKVGKTSGGINIHRRFDMYKRKSQQHGYKIEADYWVVDDPQKALRIENEIRSKLLKSSDLPWDKK